MHIELTEEEKAELSAMTGDLSLLPELDQRIAKLPQDSPERERLLKQKNDLLQNILNRFREFYSQAEARRFAEVAGNREAIIEQAKDQIRILTEYPAEIETVKKFSVEEGLESAEILDNILDVYYKEISLHLEALQDDPAGLATIKTAIAQSLKELEIDIPAITAGFAKKLDFPLDKVNSKIWNLLEVPTGKQLAFSMLPKRKLGIDKDVIYSLDFSEVEKELSISRKLEPYDKLVYIAVSSLYNAGFRTVTLRQIYAQMGKDGRASNDDLAKINNSITKMMRATLHLDNGVEAARAKNRRSFIYDGALLQAERIQAIVNGQLSESAIHLFREPPMITFAKQRQQITTIKRSLLAAPLNLTNQNIALQNYLIERIAHIKKGSISNKILYNTIFENVNISTPMQKQRAVPKIIKLMEYYQKEKFIKGFKTEKDGVIIKY